MTLIAGIIHGGSVVLVADSAITIMDSKEVYEGQTPSGSSFGETSTYENESWVEDNSQKIIVLKESIICTYAGSQSEGLRVLEDLNLALALRPDASLSIFLKEFLEEINPKNTQYIFGFHEQGRAVMLCHVGSTIMDHEEGTFVLLGNARDNRLIHPPLEVLARHISGKGDVPSVFLAKFVSLAQCYAINANSYQTGVGGHFNGAYVDSSGVSWMEDSFNILYSSYGIEAGEKFAVVRYNRDGATYISSPRKAKSVHFPSLMFLGQTLEQWTEKWFHALLSSERQINARFYIFI